MNEQQCRAIDTMPRLLNKLRERDPKTNCFRRIANMEDFPNLQAEDISSAEFFEQIDRCAAVLASRGLSGKHIGLFGISNYSWLVHFCAVFAVGSVAVLLDPELSATELEARAAHSDLSALLFDPSREETVLGAAMLNVSCFPMEEAYDSPSASDGGRADASVRAEDLACILYTSGTTSAERGLGKAVMLSHRAMTAGICHSVLGYAFRAQLAVMPFHHIAGVASVFNTLYLGAVVCLAEDMKYLFRYLEVLMPDYVLCVPSVLRLILQKLKKAGVHGSARGWDIRMLGCGGATFPSQVIDGLHAQDIRVMQSYGATEAGGLGFEWEMTSENPNTIGKPCKEVEIKIGKDGELFLRSASIMMGYYKNQAATDAVLRDGWYATGDLCRQDEEGYLYLTGRKKNLIILSNGENISPEEIEAALCASCSDIEEVLVSAEDDRIAATVYPALAADADERQWTLAKQRITGAITEYNVGVPLCKQVQKLHFSEKPLEKNSLGKLKRNHINDMGGEVK